MRLLLSVPSNYGDTYYGFLSVTYITIISLVDWHSDQYRWSNQGVHLLPKKNPNIKKSYFQIDTTEGPTNKFIKHAYQLINSTRNAVLIHHLGEDGYATDFPHGNSRGESQRPHSRTCPLLMNSLKESCKYGTVASVY